MVRYPLAHFMNYNQKFKELKNDSVNDLPNKILKHEDEDYYLHKCRNNYLMILSGYMGLYLINNEVSENRKNNINELITNVSLIGKRRWGKKKQPEDIQLINLILDYMIGVS